MRLPIIAFLACVTASMPVRAEVLAVVNGAPVTTQDVKRIRSEMAAGTGTAIKARSALARIDEIALLSAVERKVLASAARKAGLDRDPAVMLKLRAAGPGRERREQVLHASWMTELESRTSAVGEDKLQTFYEHAVTAPRYRLKFLHFPSPKEASDALKAFTSKADFEAALASRTQSRATFPDADVLNYGRPAFDSSPPVMQLFLAASDWTWRQVGIDLGSGAIGSMGGPICEGLLCSIWTIDDIETAPPRPFDALSSEEMSTMAAMRADLAARAAHSEALRSAEVTWKTTVPATWNSILARPPFTEE